LLKTIAKWVVLIFLTLGFLVWQKVSGPTYEKSGSVELGSQKIDIELLRTHSINGDMPVRILVAEGGPATSDISGTVIWRRYPTKDEWARLPMVYKDGFLTAELPRQPMAGKLEYSVELAQGSQTVQFPQDEAAVARFKGDVPNLVLICHVFCMIMGMFFSTGAGLEALFEGRALKTLSRLAFAFLLLGGLILGPVVQKYAFDAYWTGWPFGSDWTDNKLALGALVWALAVWRSSQALAPGADYTRQAPGRWWAVLATVTIIVIYSIPHSIHGSTFDYETGEHIQTMMLETETHLG